MSGSVPGFSALLTAIPQNSGPTETHSILKEKGHEARARIRRPKTRRACLTKLAARGEQGAKILALVLDGLSPEDDRAAVKALLETLVQMGPSAGPAVPVLEASLQTWPRASVLTALRTLADLAPFHKVRELDGDHMLEETEIAGRRIRTHPELKTADFLHEVHRIKHRGKIRGKTSPSQLVQQLQIIHPSKFSRGFDVLRYEAVLDVLLHRAPSSAPLPESLCLAVENLLVEPQSDVLVLDWASAQAAKYVHLKGADFVRPKAARLLKTYAKSNPASSSAHAWVLSQTKHDEAVRMRAAMALGTARLTDRRRTLFAVRALMDAAKGESLPVAREAVTAIGMLGKAALIGFPVLKQLAKHKDANLRARAKSAIQSLRKAIR